MAQVYDNTDFFWTARGDFFLGGNGDIQDTEDDPLRSLIQEIKTRIEGNQYDWENNPEIGAGIGDFVGEPNNKQTAEAIKTRIINALTSDGFIQTKDIKVKYMPVNSDHILFRISVDVAPTVTNRSSTQILYNLVYSYSNNNVYSVR